MATLADLFVSYKSVQPEPTQNSNSTNWLNNLVVAKSRLQQIEESQNNLTKSEELTPINGQELEDIYNKEISETDENLEETKDSHTQRINLIPFSEMNFMPKGPVIKYNRGNLDKEIKDLFKRNGINIVVTSGKRPAGATGKAGARSHHVGGNAVDITPGSGETFESIKQKMKSSPEILQFFYENGLGVIDETNAATMKKTGATGKHFHIGPDQIAVETWSNWMRTVPINYSTSLNYIFRNDTVSKAAEFISKEENNTSFNAPLSRKMLSGYTLKGERHKTYGYGLVYNPEHPGKTMAQVKSTYTQSELQRLAKKNIENNLKIIDSYGVNLTENQRVVLARRYHFGPQVSKDFMEYIKKNGVPTAQGFFNWWYNKLSKMKNADKYLNGWTNGLYREMQLWQS